MPTKGDAKEIRERHRQELPGSEAKMKPEPVCDNPAVKKTAKFVSDVPLKRAGEPVEVAPSYLYLACNNDSSYITGQVLHPNGGEIING